ncbi:MAG: TonB-dependent receptor plug domain-containing protein [Janthinobacterium lividum]
MPRLPITIAYIGLIVAAPVGPAGAQVQDQANTRRFDVEAGRLADALTALGAETGLNLLFSSEVVGERKSASVHGKMSVDDALGNLLAGSNLRFRRTADGFVLIYAVTEPAVVETIPEILVVGHRTQNVDIRRTENDIQPYNVAGSAEISFAHPDNVDDFLRTRLTSDAQGQSAAQDSRGAGGSVRSEINLHGLGADQTLVLIDGARMPRIPGTASFYQPDVNGLSVDAIDRIESLTATAGGIYGPDATGGVINVVLKREYRGADFSVSYGLTDRGDAERRRVSGRIGFTPDGGRTDVMIAVAHSDGGGLVAGDRDYVQRSRALLLSQTSLADFVRSDPPADAILVHSTDGDDLALKPGYGRAVLASPFSYLPIGGDGGQHSQIALLLANAGKFPDGLSPDGGGTGLSVISNPTTTSLLVNVRHRFGQNVEAFVDLIRLQNDGRGVSGSLDPNIIISDLAPTNPFSQPVSVSLPLPGFDSVYRTRLASTRLSAGVILHLPRQWTAEGDLRAGGVDEDISVSGFSLNRDADAALSLNVAGAGGEPALNPFGDWKTFVTALQQYKVPRTTDVAPHSRFRDASLRLAGPLFTTNAGAVTLSLLAEDRWESVGAPLNSLVDFGNTVTVTGPPYSQSTVSAYGELRAPIHGRDVGPWLLRGLELQGAVRWDENRSATPTDYNFDASEYNVAKSRRGSALFTVGFRSFPTNWLLFRSSLSTGELPPAPLQLVTGSEKITFDYGADPKRGGQQIGSQLPFELLYGGSPRLISERAKTLSAGVVLNPDAQHGLPRISMDVTHTERDREISNAYFGNVDYFLANEKSYPDRVTRAALTPADAAAGFTGGLVTQVDTTASNIGTTVSDALDLRADDSVRAFGGTLHLYGSATWEPRLRQRLAPELPATDLVGNLDGPLEWRGNAGIDWQSGVLKIGLNGQYYGAYHAVYAYQVPIDAASSMLDLPGVHIPAQVYIDFAASYRIELASHTGFAQSLDLRFGILNIFDKAPPIATSSALGYSYYGDPRRRRFELTLTAHR